MSDEQQVTGRLEDWHVQKWGLGTRDEFIIWGLIYDDANGRFQDGTWIHTSGVKDREIKEGDVVKTRNSTYLLGKPRLEEVS